MERQSFTTNPALDAFENISKGNLPTNKQFSGVVESTQEFLNEAQHDRTIPFETKQVLSDAKEVIEAAQQLVDNKNADEHLQKFAKASVEATKEATEGMDKEVLKEKLQNVDQHGELKAKGQQLLQESKRAGQAALEVLQSMIRSGEFRTWIMEFVGLMHDIILKSSIQNGPSGVQKSIWVPSGELEPQQQQQPHTGTSMSASGTKFTADPRTGLLHSEEPLFSSDRREFKQQTDSQMSNFTWGNVSSPDQWKLEIPEDTKHELSHRFIILLRRFNRNTEFSKSVQNFFEAIDDLRNEASRLVEETTTSKKFTTTTTNTSILQPSTKVTEPLQTAYDEVKELIHDFSGRSPDHLINFMNDFFHKLKDDKEMNQWRTDVRSLFNDVIKTPEMIDEFSLTKRVEELIDRGRQVFNNSEWRESYNKLTNEFWSILENIKEDPDVQKLNEKLQKFVQDFTHTDEKGERHFNLDLMAQMREFVAPLLIKQLEHIPMPPLEGSNSDADWRIENLVFSGSDIIPEHVQINFRSDIDFNVKKLATDRAYTRALILIRDIHVKIPNIHFWFRHKSIPRIEDEGIASVECSGDRTNLQILFRVSGGLENPSFMVSRVHCDLGSLSINIKESRHSFLLNIITFFYENKWKHEIEHSVEQRIKSIFNQIEIGLSNVFQKYPPSKIPSLITEQFSALTTSSQEKKMPEKRVSETDALLGRSSPKDMSGRVKNTTVGSPKTVSSGRIRERTSAH